jgi:hypothetical protein
VETPWRKDPTLKKVVDVAISGITQFLTSTMPEQVGDGQLVLKKVLSFESQVFFRRF